jgi:ribosomal protein S5
VIAGGAARAVLECAGVHDILAEDHAGAQHHRCALEGTREPADAGAAEDPPVRGP